MNRRDPRIRQTLDRFQSNIETANINAQAGLYEFAQYYINPCLQSAGACLQETCGPCFAPPQRRTRPRHLSRGTRPEQSFDFYNDVWDEDYMEDGEANERTGLLSGWGAPDLDRLLAGTGGGSSSPGASEQPRRHASMNYGSRGPPSAGLAGPTRGRSGTAAKGGEVNPNEVPASSMFGFLESLPWKIGRRGFRYRPSAANLQENPHRKADDVNDGASRQRLLDESDADDDYDVEDAPRAPQRRGLSAAIAGKGGHLTVSGASGSGSSRPRIQRHHSDQPTSPSARHGRKRSSTNASHATTNSLSSRGDLFPSDDEDDAVPLDDEFATVLERRTTTSSGRRRRRSSGDGEREGAESGGSRSGSNVRSASSKGSSKGSKTSRTHSHVVDSEEEPESQATRPDFAVQDTMISSQVLDAEGDDAEVTRQVASEGIPTENAAEGQQDDGSHHTGNED